MAEIAREENSIPFSTLALPAFSRAARIAPASLSEASIIGVCLNWAAFDSALIRSHTVGLKFGHSLKVK